MWRHVLTDWWNNSRVGRFLLFAFFIMLVAVFAGAILAIIHALTRWPLWVQIIVSLPSGFVFLISFARATVVNGFDGIVSENLPETKPDEQ